MIDLSEYFNTNFSFEAKYEIVKNAIYLDINKDIISFASLKKISSFFETEDIYVDIDVNKKFMTIEIYGIDGSKYI